MPNFNPKNPSRYLGTNKYITFFVSRERRPTLADYRQPETGTLYSVGTVWQVGKAPSTGSEGELWMLSKIVANQGYWIQISSGAISPIESFQVDAFTAPGTNPVIPTLGGLVTITGAQIANAALANVIRTDSLAANTFTIEIQQAALAAATDATKNGVAHFNSAHFTVGANAFISSQIATTSQIGIVTLATQTQSEFNTYGTNQVLQVGEITHMMAKPAPIGSTTPNTGAFTSLSSNAGQTFSAALDVFPSESVTVLSNGYSSANVALRLFINGATPASIVAGFGTGIEIFCQKTDASNNVAAAIYGAWTDVTLGAETSKVLIRTLNGGTGQDSFQIFNDRTELLAGSRLRLGSAGVDFMSGTGDPNGSVTAAKGSLYMRVDGSSVATRAYINTNGSTTWTNLVTAA